MFSQASVILFKAGGGEGVMVGAMCGGGMCMAGGMCSGGGCMAGWCIAGGGACVAGETATTADGLHPTGMNSC